MEADGKCKLSTFISVRKSPFVIYAGVVDIKHGKLMTLA